MDMLSLVVSSRFLVIIGVLSARPFVAMCAIDPHVDPRVLQLFHLSNHYQCQRLCWFTLACKRYSFYIKWDNSAAATNNCVLHSKERQSAGSLNDGWTEGVGSKDGLPLHHGCSSQPCGAMEICMKGKRHTDHVCVPYEFNKAPWKDDYCDSSSDCDELNAVCHANKCLCQPGFYYSVGTKTCVATCLQTEGFSKYQDSSAITAVTPIKVDSVWGSMECYMACFYNSTCRAFQYKTGPEILCAHYAVLINPLVTDVESDWYQKDCA